MMAWKVEMHAGSLQLKAPYLELFRFPPETRNPKPETSFR